MKRSEINKAIKNLEALCKKHHFELPPFCHFTPSEWKSKIKDYQEVKGIKHHFDDHEVVREVFGL